MLQFDRLGLPSVTCVMLLHLSYDILSRFLTQTSLLFKLPLVLFRRYHCRQLCNFHQFSNHHTIDLPFGNLVSTAVQRSSSVEYMVLEIYLSILFGVMQGLRPTIPENINPRLTELLHRCWETNSIERPEFSEITGLLEEILKEVCLC